MAFYNWSKTAATNASADATINWAEGMPPAQVNDSGRAMMAAAAQWRDDVSGTITTGGTSTAYTVASNQVFDTLAHMNGAMIAFIPHTNNGTPVTLNVDSLGAKPLRSAPGVELVANEIVQGAPYVVTYINADGAFYLQNATGLPPSQATNTLLGNVSGSTARPTAITIGGGLLVTGSTLSAPAVPVAASFKNLAIKVATNTTVSASADFITVTDGTNYQTLPFNGTVNLGTTGANALDTGTIAIDTWYAMWAIAQSNGTTAWLASTSFTAPTMPGGYTYKARVGAVQTIHGTATLYGTWQLGRRAQYVVGLAQTAALPVIASGAVGTFSTTAPVYAAQSLVRFVPTAVASRLLFTSAIRYNNLTQASILVAPNASYSGPATTNPPPFAVNVGAAQDANYTSELVLESSSVYFASSAAGGALLALGWEDNI